jgi:hypothetical protein
LRLIRPLSILAAFAGLFLWIAAQIAAILAAAAPLPDASARFRAAMLKTSATVQATDAERLRAIVDRCKADPNPHARFAWSVLGCDTGTDAKGRPYDRTLWRKQRDICRSVHEVPITIAVAGNAVGKSYVAARLALSYLYQHPDCLVFTSAPTQTQLHNVLWKEIRRAHSKSRIPLGGKIGGDPIRLDVAEGWTMLGHVSNKVEAMSGHHARDLLVIIDEASGAPPAVYEAANSLSPSRTLLIGNPLRADGRFFDLAQQAMEGRDGIRLIHMPSTESPDIHLQRSPRGMADKGFLEINELAYGTRSLWWKSHIDALFPGQNDDVLILREWLKLAGQAIHRRGGPVRLAIDLSVGNGMGDRTVIIVRDDNGILHCEWSRSWSLEASASRVAQLAQRFGVKPHLITYDRASIGQDFGNRLAQVGIVGAVGYLGGSSTGYRFPNLRTAAAWLMRLRLDPDHKIQTPAGLIIPQIPFAIPREFLALMQSELEKLHYTHDGAGRVCLENADKFAERCGCSPDFADCMGQLWAYPNAA